MNESKVKDIDNQDTISQRKTKNKCITYGKEIDQIIFPFKKRKKRKKINPQNATTNIHFLSKLIITAGSLGSSGEHACLSRPRSNPGQRKGFDWDLTGCLLSI